MSNLLRRLDCIVGRISFFLWRTFCNKLPLPTPTINQKNKRINTILCMKLWGLGNLVIIYPLLHKIKEKFLHSRLTFITFDLNKEFLEENQAIDRVLYFKFTKNIFKIIKQFIGLLFNLKKEKIDLLINFETLNNLSALFSYLTGAEIRIGLNNKYEKIFYNYSIYNEKSLHISRLFVNILEPLDINYTYNYFYFIVRESEKEKIESFLEKIKIKKFICIHPGTSDNFPGKKYKKDYFSELSNLLIDKYSLPILFTGVKKEKSLVTEIIKTISTKEKSFNLAGELTILEFIELLRKSFLLITNDTGPVHIAASLNINLTVFYGPTSPQRYKPLNKNSLIFYKNTECSPCVGINYVNKRCKNNFECLNFSPKEVFFKISEKFFHEQRN